MSVTAVKAINYKIHEKIDINPNGRSFFVVGDTEEGKSTFIEIILESLGIIPFDKDPLMNGKDSGSIEVSHDFGDGNIYTVKRRFTKKGLMRFEVFDQNGGEHTLKVILEKIFGKAFTNSYFDYKSYWYDQKSAESRFEYFVKAIGGDPVFENKRTIKTKTLARNDIGGNRATYQSLLEKSIINPETIVEDSEKYKEEKKLADIYQDEAYVAITKELEELEAVQQDYDLVLEQHAEFDVKVSRNTAIDLEVIELEKQIKALKAEKKLNNKWLVDFPADKKYEAELADKVTKSAEHKKVLDIKLKAALQQAEENVFKFNATRLQFNTEIEYLKKFKQLNADWIKLNNEIKQLQEDNEVLFKEKMNIPELSISEDDVILYTCKDGVKRELCFPNISRGASIRLTAQIQKMLNPKGNNFIVIPDAKLLGSALYPLLDELKHFGMQYIVEITEEKKKFHIKFEEEIPKK